MKRYKIVEKDNTFTLYERNKEFILGLKLLPLSVILLAGIGCPDDRIAFLFFCFKWFCGWLQYHFISLFSLS